MFESLLFPGTALARGYRGAGQAPHHVSHVVSFPANISLTAADAAVIAIADRDVARVIGKFVKHAKPLHGKAHASLAELRLNQPEAERWLQAAETAAFLPDVRSVDRIRSDAAYLAIFGGDFVLSATALKVWRIKPEETYAAALSVAVGLACLAQYIGTRTHQAGEVKQSSTEKSAKRGSAADAVVATAAAVVGLGMARYLHAADPKPPLPAPTTQELFLTTVAFTLIQIALVVAGVVVARNRAPRNARHAELAQQQRKIGRTLRRVFKRWEKSTSELEKLRSQALQRVQAIRHAAIAAIYEGREGRSRRHPDAVWHPALQTPVVDSLFAPLGDELTKVVDPLPADLLPTLRQWGIIPPDMPSASPVKIDAEEHGDHVDAHDDDGERHDDDDGAAGAAARRLVS